MSMHDALLELRARYAVESEVRAAKRVKYEDLFPGFAGSMEDLLLKEVQVKNKELLAYHGAQIKYRESIEKFYAGVQKDVLRSESEMKEFLEGFCVMLRGVVGPLELASGDGVGGSDGFMELVGGWGLCGWFGDDLRDIFFRLAGLFDRVVTEVKRAGFGGEEVLEGGEFRSFVNTGLTSIFLVERSAILKREELRKVELFLGFVTGEVEVNRQRLSELEIRNGELMDHIERLDGAEVEPPGGCQVDCIASDVPRDFEVDLDGDMQFWRSETAKKERVLHDLRKVKYQLLDDYLEVIAGPITASLTDSATIRSLWSEVENQRARVEKLEIEYENFISHQESELMRKEKSYRHLIVSYGRKIRDLYVEFDQATGRWKREEQDRDQNLHNIRYLQEMKDPFQELIEVGVKSKELQERSITIFKERMDLEGCLEVLRSVWMDDERLWREELEKVLVEYSFRFGGSKVIDSSLIRELMMEEEGEEEEASVMAIGRGESMVYLSLDAEGKRAYLEARCGELEERLCELCGFDRERMELVRVQASLIELEERLKTWDDRERRLVSLIDEKYTEESALQGEVLVALEGVIESQRIRLRSYREEASRLRVEAAKKVVMGKATLNGVLEVTDECQERFEAVYQVNRSLQQRRNHLFTEVMNLERKIHEKQKKSFYVTRSVGSHLQRIYRLEKVCGLLMSILDEEQERLERIKRECAELDADCSRSSDGGNNETILERYRSCYNCSLCARSRVVEIVLVACGHVFCSVCIEERCMGPRNLKCPECAQRFEKSEALRLSFA